MKNINIRTHCNYLLVLLMIFLTLSTLRKMIRKIHPASPSPYLVNPPTLNDPLSFGINLISQ